MDIQIIMNGTLKNFASIILTLEFKYSHRKFGNIKDSFFESGLTNIKVDDNTVELQMIFGKESHRKSIDKYYWEADLRAQKLPGNKCLILVHCNDETWPNISDIWNIIHGELVSQGWIAQKPHSPKAELPQKPNDTARVEEWFDYYHAMKKARETNRQVDRYTLYDLANDAHVSPSNIRKRHLGCSICTKGTKEEQKNEHY